MMPVAGFCPRTGDVCPLKSSCFPFRAFDSEEVAVNQPTI
jgi:hypothetical protein